MIKTVLSEDNTSSSMEGKQITEKKSPRQEDLPAVVTNIYKSRQSVGSGRRGFGSGRQEYTQLYLAASGCRECKQ